MYTLTINFLGVCTIFRDLPPEAGSANRVVLVRTPPGFPPNDPPPILPHIAKLQILTAFTTPPGEKLPPYENQPNTFKLEGVWLTVNQQQTQPLTGTLACLPSLQKALPTANLGLPADFVLNPNLPGATDHAQAWFDVPQGSWNGFLMNPCPSCKEVPSVSVLDIQMDDPPVLHYRQVGGTTIPVSFDPDETHHYIAVENFADGEAIIKDERDFYLNYLTAQDFSIDWIPQIQIPKTNACTKPSPLITRLRGCGDAGPGCSNTGFP